MKIFNDGIRADVLLRLTYLWRNYFGIKSIDTIDEFIWIHRETFNVT